jgi:hypothetical protein
LHCELPVFSKKVDLIVLLFGSTFPKGGKGGKGGFFIKMYIIWTKLLMVTHCIFTIVV